MAISGNATRRLRNSLGSSGAAAEFIAQVDSAFVTPAAVVAAPTATTNLTAVPASFADLAAVQAYLAGANVVPGIEARLDLVEARVAAILVSLKAAGLMATS